MSLKDKVCRFLGIEQEPRIAEFGKESVYDESVLRKRLNKNLNSKGFMIKLYEVRTAGHPGNGNYVENISPVELLSYPSCDAFLKERYGDGIYNVLLYNDNEVDWKYSAYIGNAELKKKRSEGKDTEKGKRLDRDELVLKMVDKFADVALAQKNTNNVDILKYFELMQTAQSQAFSNALQLASAGADPLESAERLIGISKAIQPAIQPEDSMTSLINAIPALAGLAVNLKQQQPMGQVPQALPPGQTQAQLTPQQLQQVQAYIQQLQSGQTQAQLAGTQPQPQITPQAQTPAQDISKSSNDEHRQFYSMYIDKIRKSVTGGESDYDIAKKIIDMMEYSVDYMRNDPHPLVAGMVANMDNAVGLNAELYKFFNSIPELAGLKDKQDSIQASIVEIYTGGPPDDADNADLGAGDADQQDGEAVPGQVEEPEGDQSQLP